MEPQPPIRILWGEKYNNMLEKIQERVFPFIIALAALSVSASAAFYSVTGLSKLFAGASFEVMIMAGSLEAAKLVIASLLYQYRKTLPKVLKGYLMAACLVLILITSMGIYGFLSSAYQETASKSGMVDAEIVLIETKRDNVNNQLETYNLEKENLDKAIADLRKGLANNVITYTDENGNQVTTTSSSTRRALERQLDQSNERQSNLNAKIDDLNTQLFDYENEILEVKSSSDVAGELGPLKYLSGLTGWPMDKIINILLLTIIFVFDPLAIALVIAANYAFEQLKRKEEEEEDEDVDDHNLDLALNDIADSIWGDSEVQSILRHSVTPPTQPHLTEETGTEGISENPILTIEEQNLAGSYSSGYAFGVAEEEPPIKNTEVQDEPEEDEEIIEKEEVEDFDDDGGTIIEEENIEELEGELKTIPKSHKYGPDGWKSVKKKIEELRNKENNDDLTIKY